MSITYVTAFYKLYNVEKEPYTHKNIQWRIDNFRVLAKSGIKIVIYSCENTREYINNLCNEFPDNLFHGKLLTPYEETEIYKICMKKNEDGSYKWSLPANKNEKKDTYEYLSMMNCKIEFMRDAVIQNHWNSHYFAWMDFSMAYLFHDKENTAKKMFELAIFLHPIPKNTLFIFSSTLRSDEKEFSGEPSKVFVEKLDSLESPRLTSLESTPCERKSVIFPGCWEKISSNYYTSIKDNISWRFCGTFFIGDMHSILEMYQYYIEHLPRFINETNKLVWEVNIWAWLEANTLWKPEWYSSDHNDRLITDLFTFLENKGKTEMGTNAEVKN